MQQNSKNVAPSLPNTRMSDSEKLELFEVEELEARLEMVAPPTSNSCCGNSSCNCTCSY